MHCFYGMLSWQDDKVQSECGKSLKLIPLKFKLSSSIENGYFRLTVLNLLSSKFTHVRLIGIIFEFTVHTLEKQL